MLASGVEVGASVVIAIAALEALVRAMLLFAHRYQPPGTREKIRLSLGRWLVLALEFELAADILRTAVAPTWNEIGQLAAIATLRTLLNFFLEREIAQTSELTQQELA
jgi:uncharacterized membrane protein